MEFRNNLLLKINFKEIKLINIESETQVIKYMKEGTIIVILLMIMSLMQVLTTLTKIIQEAIEGSKPRVMKVMN